MKKVKKNKLPSVMLVSVDPELLEAFKQNVESKIGKRKMSPLIASWMREYINGGIK